MSEELYFNDELRKCLNAAGLSDCGENDAWNYWYQRLHKAHDQAVDRVTEASELSKLQNENAKLREFAARAWRLFTENGAVHSNDLPEVDAVRDGLCKLGVKVDLIND